MQKQKKEIIESLKINSKDVGSSEVQLGLLSNKIDNVDTTIDELIFQKSKIIARPI